MPATLTFTETGHLYHRDGQIIPSVTQVLDLAGITEFPQIPQALRWREMAAALGKAVHIGCHGIDCGDLDVDTVDPRIAHYLWAYKKFADAYEPEWKQIEEPLCNDADELPFAGTPDRVGTITIEHDRMRCVLDIKTPRTKAKHWGLQTAGYKILVGGDPLRAVLWLKDSGDYELDLQSHRDDRQLDVFRAALTVAHWRLAHGTRLKGDAAE